MVHSKYNFSLLESPFIKCWDKIFNLLTKKFLFITLGFFSFPPCYAHSIREVTVGDLDLIHVICEEKNFMNEVARIKKMLCYVKKIMVYCAAINCTNSSSKKSDNNFSFFKVPQDSNRRKASIATIKNS